MVCFPGTIASGPTKRDAEQARGEGAPDLQTGVGPAVARHQGAHRETQPHLH